MVMMILIKNNNQNDNEKVITMTVMVKMYTGIYKFECIAQAFALNFHSV